MGDLDRAMDSMDELSLALKKIDRYNFLFYLTGRMIISVLVFAALLLFGYILLLMHDFQNINPYFGTIKTGGYGIGGTFVDVFVIFLVIGAAAVYLETVFLNRALRGRDLNIVPFDRTKGRDGIAGAITGIDWGKTRSELKSARFSFIIYNVSIIGIYSFLLFFILQVLYIFLSTVIIYFLHITVSLSGTLYFQSTFAALAVLSVVISIAILRKKLRESFRELKELDGILEQLRWFLDEFEKSGFQA